MYIIPAHTYPVLMIVLPIVFRLINRKLTWVSIICAVVIELIMYWDDFCYYEGRPFMILFTLIQIIIMVILTVILNLIGKKKD